jgi:hypothetical protein
MARLQVTLAQLMALVLFLGLGFAALRNANGLWASLSYTVAIVMISAAPLGAAARRGIGRLRWAGFAIFGWIYVLIAQLPYMEAQVDRDRLQKPLLPIEWAIDASLPFIHPSATFATHEYQQIAHSLGIIVFGLLGAITSRVIVPKDERRYP